MTGLLKKIKESQKKTDKEHAKLGELQKGVKEYVVKRLAGITEELRKVKDPQEGD